MRVGPFGLPELLIILAVLLLIFGARRLPEIGSSLGKSLRYLNHLLQEKNEKKDNTESHKPSVEATLQSSSDDNK
ncbi:MAG: hypothetical protein CM1200mP15_10670 [Dehalococcoidia bacterium]|nr:MAG: hypothetical protein CM1200mP15_10670 [Dehalococcoidia bacterium]